MQSQLMETGTDKLDLCATFGDNSCMGNLISLEEKEEEEEEEEEEDRQKNKTKTKQKNGDQ